MLRVFVKWEEEVQADCFKIFKVNFNFKVKALNKRRPRKALQAYQSVYDPLIHVNITVVFICFELLRNL